MTEPEEAAEENRDPAILGLTSTHSVLLDREGNLIASFADEAQALLAQDQADVGAEVRTVLFFHEGTDPVIATRYRVVFGVLGQTIRIVSRSLEQKILLDSGGQPIITTARMGMGGEVIVEIQGTDIIWADQVISRLQADLTEHSRSDLLDSWMQSFGLTDES